MKYLYDVCGDYSLCNKVSESSLEESKTDKYKWQSASIFGVTVQLGYHKEYGELHYLKSDSSELNGMYILVCPS